MTSQQDATSLAVTRRNIQLDNQLLVTKAFKKAAWVHSCVLLLNNLVYVKETKIAIRKENDGTFSAAFPSFDSDKDYESIQALNFQTAGEAIDTVIKIATQTLENERKKASE